MSQKFFVKRIALLKGVKMFTMVSVFDRHKAEVTIYQRLFGVVAGSLLYAAGILSDVQEMRNGDAAVVQELNEAKELLVTAMQFAGKSIIRGMNTANAKYEISAMPSEDWYVLKLILPSPNHWQNIANGTLEALEALKGCLERNELILLPPEWGS
jgi:hypothetical protein